jgi:hypothetical protein
MIAHPVNSACLADYQDRRFIPPWNRKSASYSMFRSDRVDINFA